MADRSATVADADRLAALSRTEGALDVSLLLAAQAFRLADTPTTRSALTGALDGHDGSTAPSPSPAARRTPSSPGGRTLTFRVGDSIVGWTVDRRPSRGC